MCADPKRTAQGLADTLLSALRCTFFVMRQKGGFTFAGEPSDASMIAPLDFAMHTQKLAEVTWDLGSGCRH